VKHPQNRVSERINSFIGKGFTAKTGNSNPYLIMSLLKFSGISQAGVPEIREVCRLCLDISIPDFANRYKRTCSPVDRNFRHTIT
jgi:hypothetical protein